MIKRANEITPEFREHMRDGEGTAKLTLLATPAEMNEKGRLFGKITLEPGCSIGYHVHEADCELFYVLCGTAEYSDNGKIVTAAAGDVMVCPTGTGHSIKNIGDDVLEFMAVIFNA